MITWPAPLPQRLLVDGFKQGLAENRLRSPVDAGPPKVRRRTSQNVYLISGQMVMNFDQWEVLRNFVDRTTGGGSLPFRFSDPFYRGERKLELDFVNGTGVIQGMPLLVRFGEALPSVSAALGGEWLRVALDLEVLPGPTGDFEGSPLEVLTTQRSTPASYFDADGVLTFAPANTPRLDHDPVTGEPLGLLVEPQATNLLVRSEPTISQLSKSGGDISNAAGFGPFSNAIQFDPPQETSWAYVAAPGLAEGTPVTFSVFVKTDDGQPPAFGSSTIASGLNDFYILLSGGTIAPTAFKVREIGDGIYRVSASGNAGNISDNNGIVKYATNSPRGFRVAGYQLEHGAVATSYIKTEGSQVTRAADNVSIPLSSFPWNEDEMTAFVEFSTFGLRTDIATTQVVLARGELSAAFLYQTTSNSVLAIYDGSNFLGLGPISTGQIVRAATSFGPGGLRGCVDGGAVVSTAYDGTFGSGADLYVGSQNGSTGHHYLHVRRLKMIPRQVSDDELIALTA